MKRYTLQLSTAGLLLTFGVLVFSNVGAADNANANANANDMTVNNNDAVNNPDRKMIDPNEQYALAMSRQPAVVGVDLLNHEAEGFRQLSPQALANIRDGRLNLE